MSNDTAKGAESNRKKASDFYKPFGKYVDEQTGVQVIVSKGGHAFFHKIGYTNSRTGEFTIHARNVPDRETAVGSIHFLDATIEALKRLRDQYDAGVHPQIHKDRSAFEAQKSRQSNGRGRDGFRHTGKTARKKAGKAGDKPPQTAA